MTFVAKPSLALHALPCVDRPCRGRLFAPATCGGPDERADPPVLELAVLGDSIAFGQGAARPADAIGARLAVALDAAGVAVRVSVHAVPGARSAALDPQVTVALRGRPDLALVVIGANDLTHLVPVAQAAESLGAAVRRLRAGGVEVVAVPAPDLGALPWVPAQFRGLASAASSALQAAQSQTALAAGARVVRVDTSLGAAFASDPALLSADRFHPSSKGYELITRAVLPAVTAAARDALGSGRHAP